MNLETKREFNEIAVAFKEDKFNCKTVSELVRLTREYKKDITNEEAKALLEIPLGVLKNDVELINPKKWSSEQGGYFAGNITWVDDAFKAKWKSVFTDYDFSLEDIYNLSKIVSDDFEKYRSASEFLLRNAEVTLRDDVKIKKTSNFSKSGQVFYSHILSVLK